MKPETKKTFEVAIKLCLFCSIVVSGLAVGLKSTQQQQKKLFRQQSILEAAGLWEDGANPDELYNDLINPVVVDLQTNSATDRYEPTDKELDLGNLMRNPEMYDKLEGAKDVAGIMKREAYAIVYEVREGGGETGALQSIVIPVRGRGLWSTLYGFIALDLTQADGGSEEVKVAGLTYYKHAETPGLGGEVDNALWKAKWPGKSIYDDSWNVKVEVAKNASTDYQVDALSGATLTSNGVTNMLKYWLGDDGFGPYLQSLVGAADPKPKAEKTVAAADL